MSTTIYSGRTGFRFDSAATLTAAAWFWGAVVLTGQIVFAVAVAALYGGSALSGNMCQGITWPMRRSAPTCWWRRC
jgi:hypothetical protein